jgi:diguanylate cyclase (GGDEF)-like protein/PAS domain S-box-containing protein
MPNTSSIRTHLLLLVLAASIPLVAVVGYDSYDDVQRSVANSKTSLRMLASTMVSNTGGKISDARQILERMAVRPLVKQINPNNCDSALKDMLALNPGYTNIGYTDLNGLVICTAVPQPNGKPVNVSKALWFQNFLKENRFTVGLPHIGIITRKLESVLSTPILNDRQELVGAMYLAIDLKAFDPNIPAQLLPDGSRYGFFAEDGTMIWRNLDPEGVIGTKPNAEAARRIVEIRDGEFESLAVDGVTRFFSVVPMPGTGWIAFVGVPASEIYAEARRQAIIEGSFMLAAMAFLFFLAFTIARRITGPVVELERAARAAHEGDFTAKAKVGGPHEIAAVAQEFNAMIAVRKEADAVLRESESRFREIFDTISDAIFIHDAETGRIIDVNRRMCEMYGLTHDQALACGPDDLSAGTPPYSSAEVIEKVHLARTSETQTFDWLARAGDGHLFWVEVSLRFALIGNQQRILAVVRDISERKHAETELRIAAIAFETQEGIMITDADDVILRVNHAFTEITGYTATEAVGQTPHLLSSGRQDAVFYAAMWKCIQHAGTWQGEIWNRRKNGEVYPERLSITAVKNDAGEVTHYVATMHDITERKKAEEEINNLAFYDTLTQLPNRRMLNDRLGQTMAASKRSGHYGALMFLDLDNFKPLNDTYGHGVGDLLLIEVAQRLTGCVREVDTVARFGGDEFVVMLNELDADKTESAAQAGIIAEKIRTTLSEPYLLTFKHESESEATVEHHCAASIGVVVFNSETSAENIIKWADIAMYQAKEAGRNLIRFYEP